jgi:hypothetical protein
MVSFAQTFLGNPNLSNVVFIIFLTDTQLQSATEVFTSFGMKTRVLVWFKGKRALLGGRLVQEHENILVAWKGVESDLVCNIDAKDSNLYGTVHYQGPLLKASYIQHEGRPLNLYQKPLKLMMKLIKMFTTDGDLWVDLTCGTGTSAVRPKNRVRVSISVIESTTQFIYNLCVTH